MTDQPVEKQTSDKSLSPMIVAILALVQGLLPAMVAIIGGLWVAYTYVDNQREAQRLQYNQAAKDNRTRLIEARKRFVDAQLALYQETAKVVGKLVSWTKPTDADWDDSFRRYEQLYWTELSMVEDEGVKAAMQHFAEKLRLINPRRFTATSAEFDDLKERSYNLARALKAGIETSWDVDLSAKIQKQ